MARKPVIAIDGPVGSGKSTVARLAAQRLGYGCIETGAMYRAAAWKAQQLGAPPTDADRLGAMCRELDFEFRFQGEAPRVFVDGEDITEAIRSPEIEELASRISVLPQVREPLVAEQRRLAAGGGVVMEGRDIQTVVCPDAEVKVFLTASAQERARRRQEQLRQAGRRVEAQEEVLREIERRDARDEGRSVAPLRAAPDAVVVNTDGMSIEEVVSRVVELAKGHQGR